MSHCTASHACPVPSSGRSRPRRALAAAWAWLTSRRPQRHVPHTRREDRTDAYLDRHGEPWSDPRTVSGFFMR